MAGWGLAEREDGLITLETNIKLLDDLRSTLVKLLEAMYGRAGLPLRPGLGPGPGRSDAGPFYNEFQHRASTHFDLCVQNLVVFDKLNRYRDGGSTSEVANYSSTSMLSASMVQETMVKYADCGFPVLVAPNRWLNRYPTCISHFGESLKASIYCSSMTHGVRFHGHRDDDAERLVDHAFPIAHDSDLGDLNIELLWKLLHLISYDLDYGRVERAYLNIGLMVRTCFALDLHIPAGYIECADDLAREQTKRLFWAAWLFDSLVPQFFGLPAIMNSEEIKIEPPMVIDGMDNDEIERTEFIRHIIQSRMAARQICQAKSILTSSDESYLMPKISSLEHILLGYHESLPAWIRDERNDSPIPETIWRRRTRFCTLIENFTNWIVLYQQYLPASGTLRNINSFERLAISRCADSANIIQRLFISWLSSTNQTTDCMFRPYLYHYMVTIDIYKVSKSIEVVVVLPCTLLIAVRFSIQYLAVSPYIDGQRRDFARQSLVRLLQLYRQTPLYLARERSRLEQDVLKFLHSISVFTEG